MVPVRNISIIEMKAHQAITLLQEKAVTQRSRFKIDILAMPMYIRWIYLLDI